MGFSVYTLSYTKVTLKLCFNELHEQQEFKINLELCLEEKLFSKWEGIDCFSQFCF